VKEISIRIAITLVILLIILLGAVALFMYPELFLLFVCASFTTTIVFVVSAAVWDTRERNGHSVKKKDQY